MSMKTEEEIKERIEVINSLKIYYSNSPKEGLRGSAVICDYIIQQLEWVLNKD